MRRSAFLALLATATMPPLVSAQAQFAGQVFGAYNSATVNLSNGQFYPLQIDASGNLKVDCITGCTGGSSGTVAQGTAAAVGNAWPVFLAQGGAALSSSNGLPVLDLASGTAASGVTAPSGGAGKLGWLSGIYGQLSTGTIKVVETANVPTTDTADGSAPSTAVMGSGGAGLLGFLGTISNELAGVLSVVPAGLTGAPTVNSGTLSASTAVLAAEGSGVKRLHFKIWNFASAGGASLFCTDDGSTPTSTNASFIVYAQGGYERDAPAWVPSTAVTCLPASGSVSYRAEGYP